MIVLDTSAAVEIVKNSIDGRSLQGLMAPEETCIAPTFFRIEMASAVRNQVIRKEINSRNAVDFYNNGLALMDMLWPTEDLLPETLTEALRLNHPVYDIAYLVLARRLDATVFSFDRRLNELCDACGVQRIHDLKF